MVMVTFNANHFSLTPLPDAINDVLGHDLAAWLMQGFRERGFEVSSVIGEDYGYGFWLKLDDWDYWIAANLYGPPDDPSPLWLVHISDSAGCWWVTLRRKRPSPQSARRIARDIHTLLRNDSRIGNVEWWAHDVQNGLPTPEP